MAHGDYARSKPQPDPYLKAAERLDVRPERCLALEDSLNGVRSAASAGMMTIMVPDLIEPPLAISQRSASPSRAIGRSRSAELYAMPRARPARGARIRKFPCVSGCIQARYVRRDRGPVLRSRYRPFLLPEFVTPHARLPFSSPITERNTMNSQSSGKALQVAKTYVEAIARKDVDTIISVSADDVVCTSPIGQITGAERFRGFHGGFARMVKTVTILATYGDDQQAVVVYSADTHPVADAIVAELLKVEEWQDRIDRRDLRRDTLAAYMATRTQAQR